MRAVLATAYGPPEVLQVSDLPDPVPAASQVLVEVDYSDVGTLDRLVRSGWGKDYFDVTPPYVPGDGVGGTVRSVGRSVDQSWIGRRVVGGTGPRTPDGLSAAPIGGYADLAVIDVRALTVVPDALDLEVGTAVLNDGPTSQLLIDVTDPQSDDTVLILAAAGAAGILLAQLVRSRGATVIAAAGSQAKLAALHALGFDHTVDYSEAGWTEQVRDLADGGPSVVLDGAGAQLGQQAFSIAGRGSRVVTYGSSAGQFTEPDLDDAAARLITVTGLFDLPRLTPAQRNELVQRAMTSAQTGAAQPHVTTTPLHQAARTHRALEDRTAIGKTLLTHS